MNESQRQAYLNAMGIQPYYPRLPIAAAKASPAYVFSAPPQTSPPAATPSTNRTAIDTAPASPRPSLGATSPAPRASPARPERVAQATQVAAPAISPAVSANPGDELRFRLNYYRISDDVAVIDEVPHQQARREAGATLSLLHAILQALSIDCSGVNFDPDNFNWPLMEGIAMKNDPKVEARKALSGFIAMRQQTDRFRHLIIFAAQVEDVLLPQAQQTNRDYMEEGGQYHITLTHSLQAMLAYPELKRDVWSHLQPLRLRLTSPTAGA